MWGVEPQFLHSQRVACLAAVHQQCVLYFFALWTGLEPAMPKHLIESQATLPIRLPEHGGPGANRTLIAEDTWFTARLKDHFHPTQDGVAVRSRTS